jgi:hypothetical protein
MPGVSEQFRMMHDEELYNFYRSPNFVGVGEFYQATMG